MVREIRVSVGLKPLVRSEKYLWNDIYIYTTVTVQRLEVYILNVTPSM